MTSRQFFRSPVLIPNQGSAFKWLQLTRRGKREGITFIEEGEKINGIKKMTHGEEKRQEEGVKRDEEELRRNREEGRKGIEETDTGEKKSR